MISKQKILKMPLIQTILVNYKELYLYIVDQEVFIQFKFLFYEQKIQVSIINKITKYQSELKNQAKLEELLIYNCEKVFK
jgi:hypothetical protein